MQLPIPLLGAAVLALAASNPWPSQDVPPERKEAAARTPKFPLDVGEYSIQDLITKSGEFLGRNYLINYAEDPQGETSRVHVSKRLDLDAAGCEEVVSQLLFSKSWVMTPLDPARGVFEWIFLPGQRRTEIARRAAHVASEEVLARPHLMTFVTVSVTLEQGDANAVAGVLRQHLQHADQTGMHVITPLASNVILIRGLRDTVADQLRLLPKLDRPPTKAQQILEERLQQIERRLASLEGDKKK